jgi:hypothetical protein
MAHARCVVNVCIQDGPKKAHRVYTLDTELSVHDPNIFRWIANRKASHAGSVDFHDEGFDSSNRWKVSIFN